MTENNICSHFSPFHIIISKKERKIAKIIFDHISCHFRLICNSFFLIGFQNGHGGHFGSPIWAILDDRKSLSIAFLTISDQ